MQQLAMPRVPPIAAQQPVTMDASQWHSSMSPEFNTVLRAHSKQTLDQQAAGKFRQNFRNPNVTSASPARRRRPPLGNTLMQGPGSICFSLTLLCIVALPLQRCSQPGRPTPKEKATSKRVARRAGYGLRDWPECSQGSCLHPARC